MSDKSAIEWTDATWNPIRADHGRHVCKTISPGCDGCYASRMTHRFTGVSYGPEGRTITARPVLDQDALNLPLTWKRPRRIFVCSMTDLFGEWVPEYWILDIWRKMFACPQHTFQVLTKRPRRMQAVLRRWQSHGPGGQFKTFADELWPLKNVQLGTSIELDRYTWRAKYLRACPAAVRFISAEPLLGGLPSLDLEGIDWVIAGGESGPEARPMHPDWPRDLREKCQQAGAAFFFKQWGEWCPESVAATGRAAASALYIEGDGSTRPARFGARGDSITVQRIGRKAAGRELDGRTWDEFPEPKAVAS